jgi:hypothetical protein
LISLYLQPDKTQIVKARFKKDHTLYVTHATEIQPYYNDLNSKISKSINSGEDLFQDESDGMAPLFQELKRIVPTQYEEVYIVLPDTLFRSINCGDFLSEEEYMKFVQSKTGKKDDEVYYSFPIISSPGGQKKKTFYAINREIVNALTDAAQMENISLTSIEPASMAYLRSAGKWEKEYNLLQIFDDDASIVSYSPIAGIFSFNVPDLAKKNLEKIEDVNQVFKATFSLNDFTAEQIFTSINTNVPFTVLVDEPDSLLSLEVFQDRLAEPERLPACVDIDLAENHQQEWFIPVGTLLQNIEIENEFMPSYLNIYAANVLPEQTQLNAKFRQWKHMTKKYSRLLIVLLAIVAVVETAGIIYFSTIAISPQLQSDYDAAQKNTKDVDEEIKLLAAAKKEHEYPVEAFKELLSNRPDACGFSSISVGNNGTSTQDSAEKWVHLTAVASDPLVLQNFASTLSADEMFSHVTMNKMDTDPSGFKIADLTLGKGKIK